MVLKMESRVDFLSWLDDDMSMKILMCLEAPSDLVSVSSVSQSWRNFVVANGLCKQLCLRMFPPLHRVDHVVELNHGMKKRKEVGCSKFVEWETLEIEHRAYAFLAHGCTSFPFRQFILKAIFASSTDNYPEEGIQNTLEPNDGFERIASYWSSKGQSNPAVPETLTYKLADICIVTEVNIQPFQAYFQWGLPIYSAKSVRFRMGHPKSSMDDHVGEPFDNGADDKFMWTYTSPEFPMAQENRLQNFKLPEQVLCIGGILQIELLGRVQRQEMDSLFYICVSHVQVVGRPLSPAFGVEILGTLGKFVLKAQNYAEPNLVGEETCQSPSSYLLGSVRRFGRFELIVNMLRGQGGGVEDDDDDELD